jgi:broad specificity phosphatase PhoE
VSSVYLIRHGQAGLRQQYDSLSELGREQARLLGAYLAAQNVRFTAIYSGALERQRLTARETCGAYRNAGLPAPEIIVDPHWNEFDLDGVYRDLVPALSASDPHFKTEYEEMQLAMRDAGGTVHRTWLPCDTAVVRAWIDATHPTRAESWSAFQDRVSGAFRDLQRYRSGEIVAVFTSATPIAIWTGMALDVPNGKVMRLAGVMYNTALSTFRIRGDDLTLYSFNGIPHLTRPECRTFR